MNFKGNKTKHQKQQQRDLKKHSQDNTMKTTVATPTDTLSTSSGATIRTRNKHQTDYCITILVAESGDKYIFLSLTLKYYLHPKYPEEIYCNRGGVRKLGSSSMVEQTNCRVIGVKYNDRGVM